MVISSISCSYRAYKYSYVTRGPLLVLAPREPEEFKLGVVALRVQVLNAHMRKWPKALKGGLYGRSYKGLFFRDC